MTTDGARERAIDLSRAARERPETVDREDVRELLASADEEVRRFAIQAFRAVDWPDDELSTVVEPLQESLTADDAMLRNSALQALTDVAARDVTLVEQALDDAVALLDDDADLVRSSAVEFLFFLAKRRPSAVVDVVPTLLDRFDPEALEGRRGPLFSLAAVAREHPEAFVEDVDPFVDAFVAEGDDGPTVDTANVDNPLDRERLGDVFSNASERRRTHRTVAGIVVVNVAQSDPEAIRHRLDDVAAYVDAPDPQIQGVAIDVLGALAVDHPEAVREYLPELAATLDDGESVRERAVQALAALSQARPAAVAEALGPYADPLVDLLDAEEPPVRSASAGLLSYVGEHDPDAVASALEPARSLLDDDNAFVRGNAVWLLDAVGDERDRERLATLAESDPSDQVREAATEVLADE